MREITEMGKCANKASRVCALLNETKKNEVLLAAADRLGQKIYLLRMPWMFFLPEKRV